MESFSFNIPEKRPPYVDEDPDKLVPELVDDREERLTQAAYVAAQTFIEKYADSDTPPAPEIRAAVFTEAILSRLDTETYVQLWAAGSPYYLSHVSRHGFRDHAGMVYHTGGLYEFGNAVFVMLSDSKQLRSPFGSRGFYGSPEKIKATIRKEIFSDSMTREEAITTAKLYFDYSFGGGDTKYADKTAIHMAAEVVADDLYGGETANEVFVVFPADFIAAQHVFDFNTGNADFTKPCSELKWNDVFVWKNKFGSGLAIDAGVTFLPKSTVVDSRTGSKYLHEVQGAILERVIDTEFSEKILSHFLQPDYIPEDFRDKSYLSYEEESWVGEKISSSLQELGLPAQENFLIGEVSRALTGRHLEDVRAVLHEIFLRHNLLFKMAASDKSGVPAEEFWEEYFKNFPNRKPKHIVYYDGNPTNAVTKFLVESRIKSPYDNSENDSLLGFDANRVADRKDPRANVGREQLDSLCLEVIDEMFPVLV